MQISLSVTARDLIAGGCFEFSLLRFCDGRFSLCFGQEHKC